MQDVSYLFAYLVADAVGSVLGACAFVLAGPSAMIAALATASRLGILVKSVRFFETACQIDTVVFDKTGTLTHGQLSVAAIRASEPFGEDEALALAAAVETHSRHPVAKAIAHEARRRELVLPDAESLREVAGQGLLRLRTPAASRAARSAHIASR